jgi:hypothetical protein
MMMMVMIIDQTRGETSSSMVKRSAFKIFRKTLKVRLPFGGLNSRVEDNSSVLVIVTNGCIHVAPEWHAFLNTLITFSVLEISWLTERLSAPQGGFFSMELTLFDQWVSLGLSCIWSSLTCSSPLEPVPSHVNPITLLNPV